MKVEPNNESMHCSSRIRNREGRGKMTVITEADLIPQWVTHSEDDGSRWGLLLQRANNICAQHEVHFFRDAINGPVTATQEHYYIDGFPQSFSSEKEMLSFIRGLLGM